MNAISDNDTMVIRALNASFRQQLAWYTALAETVHKILSRLILSRGDFSGVRTEFQEKQRLLACIEGERRNAAPHVKFWQKQKAAVAGRPDARELDGVLLETENAIKRFLDGEDQLKRYLERLVRKDT